MNYYFLLYFSLLISLLGIVGWLVSEAKYEGRHSKLINRITFVFPFFALYAWFRLNLDFGLVLVFLTFGSLLIWLLAKYLRNKKGPPANKNSGLETGWLPAFPPVIWHGLEMAGW